ncbi:VQ motif-containing protein [Raphanus sativus]|uniref:Calmodulin-binding protein 25 n=1 Tax=Raphanus sativus TaxID=3726 RepID=A0A6J0LEE7_RAPSA|nr:calmodulin-binding protein 25 [Raphanus sativus]XP_056862956.1 calmodulin-binding protein 25-like [Raphanus sativus]KAJ4866990.1 VQ motif-containing protein [Raphanus sativus]KAJ4905093.1 VQ motif-containing protein [Raphanus sativus]
MASFDGLASVEPWSFRQSFNIDSWLIPDHDSDVLAKALHRSISTSTTPAGDSFSPSAYFDSAAAAAVSDLSPPQTLSNVSFVSDPDISVVGGVKRKRVGPGDKPAKRRSRVSTKKSQTTFITADAANFRHMVQQVTGAKFVGSSSPGIFSPVVKPEPHRLASRLPPPPSSSAVPTLDTSSFLSNHHQENMVNDFSSVSAPVRTAATVKSGVVGGGGSAVELDSYFPTLESWKVM